MKELIDALAVFPRASVPLRRASSLSLSGIHAFGRPEDPLSGSFPPSFSGALKSCEIRGLTGSLRDATTNRL